MTEKLLEMAANTGIAGVMIWYLGTRLDKMTSELSKLHGKICEMIGRCPCGQQKELVK